jgi:hypothetical protein
MRKRALTNTHTHRQIFKNVCMNRMSLSVTFKYNVNMVMAEQRPLEIVSGDGAFITVQVHFPCYGQVSNEKCNKCSYSCAVYQGFA